MGNRPTSGEKKPPSSPGPASWGAPGKPAATPAAAPTPAPAPAPAPPAARAARAPAARGQLRVSGSRVPNMDIYYACRIGDLGEVQCYVEAGAKLTELDRYGNMCIYYAILCGHPRVVDYLFDQGVSIDIGTAEGSRYYLCACRNDVRELVRKRAQRSKQDDTSPLFRLCFGGELPRDHHLAQVHKALHNSKAKLATKHKTGFSALDYAQLCGHRETVRALLAAGAPRTLAADLDALCCSELLADVAVTAGGRVFPAHQALLLARLGDARIAAATAAGLLRVETSSARPTYVLALPPEAAHALLRYLYSGNLLLPACHSREVLSSLRGVAAELQLEHLASLVGGLLSSAEPFRAVTFPFELPEQLRAMLKSGELADLVLELQPSARRVRVHRAVLCARSDYFRGLLAGGMREAGAAVVSIDETELSEAGLRLVLEFVYTEQLPVEQVTGELALELVRIASLWLLQPLRTLAEEILLTEFSVAAEDVAQLYAFAVIYGASRFEHVCYDILLDNFFQAVAQPGWEEIPIENRAKLAEIAQKRYDNPYVKQKSTKK